MSVPTPMIEYVQRDGAVLGIIIPPDVYTLSETHFPTQSHEFLQAGVLNWSAGRIVEPHWHPPRTRIVSQTQEALFVRRGEIRIEFYDNERRYVTFRRVGAGTVVVLLSGGHGLRAITDSEIVEIKQGPYNSEKDKVHILPKEQS